MVSVSYDYFGLLEKPVTTLCNPNNDELYSLGNSYNNKLSLKYNALSEYSFDIQQTIQDVNGNNIIDPAYVLIKPKRKVYIENFGYFQIMSCPESRDSDVPIKSVKCASHECELITKQFSGVNGSFKFYDYLNPTGTFLDYVLSGTGWSVDSVDDDLLNLYRDFSSSSGNIYNLLMTTAETAFNCIFIFDYFDKLVSAVTVDNATHNTSIFMSFDNLLTNTNFNEIAEEIVTSMEVFGGDGLDIRNVNPLGTDKIYNFSYYQQRGSDGKLLWMSEGLNAAINIWVTKVNSYQASYASLLTTLQNANISLGVKQGELSILNDELAALIQVKKVQIEGNQSLTSINAQIAAKRTQITSKNSEINSLTLQIAQVTTQIININNILSLTNIVNFSLAQQSELKTYIYENTYQNDNIIQTTIMTPAEIQDQAQQLYEQAQVVLAKTSQPRYEFSVDSVNFVALSDFQVFSQQLDLGANVTIETNPDVYITTAVLEINLDFEKLDNFSLTFSNRLRLDNGNYIYSDLLNNINQTTSTVINDKGSWNGYTIAKPTLLNINSILNTANNQIINSSAQEITISSAGLIGKHANLDGTFSNEQIWVTSNLIVFSDDAFTTAKLALGKITLPNGGTKFGLAGEAVFGKILAGNSLLISNLRSDGQVANFTLDDSGCVLTNSTFIINSSSARNSLELSANNGFVLKNKVGSIIISTDGNGNLTIIGAVTANSGSFTGAISSSIGNIGSLVIDSNGLHDSNGNFLQGNGNFKWGPFSVVGNVGTFSGTIDANQLLQNGHIINTMIANNTISSGKIHDLSADKITVGTLTGVTLFGGTLAWPGVVSTGTDYGVSLTTVNTRWQVQSSNPSTSPSASILTEINNQGTFLINSYDSTSSPIDAFFQVGHGKIVVEGILDLSGTNSITLSTGKSGLSGNYSVQLNGVGYKMFTFSKGILISVV